MNSESDRKPEPIDPEANLRMIEMELMQQRAARQRAGNPYKGLRTASFIFLVLIIVGALAAFYYLLMSGKMEELREMRSLSTSSSSTVTPSPSP